MSALFPVIYAEKTEKRTTEVSTAEIPTAEVPQIPTQEEEVVNRMYVTKAGEKYHLNRGRRALKGYSSFEKRPCRFVHQSREQTKRILVFNQSQPTPQEETELAFADNDEYHHKDCLRWRTKVKIRPVCVVCEDEERALNYARNRMPTEGQSRND